MQLESPTSLLQSPGGLDFAQPSPGTFSHTHPTDILHAMHTILSITTVYCSCVQNRLMKCQRLLLGAVEAQKHTVACTSQHNCAEHQACCACRSSQNG